MDLTNTTRFYCDDIEFRQKNIGYEKIRCIGYDMLASSQLTRLLWNKTRAAVIRKHRLTLKSIPSFKSVNVSLALTRRMWSVLLSYCHTGRTVMAISSVHIFVEYSVRGQQDFAHPCLMRGIFVYLLIQVLSKWSILLLKHERQASTNRTIWIVYKRNLVHRSGVLVGDHPLSFD